MLVHAEFAYKLLDIFSATIHITALPFLTIFRENIYSDVRALQGILFIIMDEFIKWMFGVAPGFSTRCVSTWPL